MKSIFRATAILGSSSAVNAIVGLVSAKLWAVMVGPAGVGYLAMQQSVLGISAMVAGLGVATGIVRLGAKSVAEDDKLTVAANQKAAVLIAAVTGIGGAVLLFLFGDFINQSLLEGKSSGREIGLIGSALIFTLLASSLTGILNAHHNVKALAKIAVFSNVFSAGALIVCVWAWRIDGIVIGILAGAVLSCGVNYYYFKREVKTDPLTVPREKLIETIRNLLRFGVPYTGSMLVGTGVQLILPILILHELGLESVGFYRAATTIAVTSLSLVMNAMAQDYYPRLSACSGTSEELSTIINQQLYLLFVLLSPIILWLLLLSPIVVPLLYSAKFTGSAEILNWFLVGDVFRLLSWTLSFVILARSKSRMFFLIELFGGMTSLVTTLVGMRLFGPMGLGISYLTTFCLYYLLVLFLVRRQFQLRYSRENKIIALSCLASAAGISTLTALGYENLRTVFGITVCLIFSATAFSIVMKKFFRGGDEPAPA
jgi:enterobacterial common antigen flippase